MDENEALYCRKDCEERNICVIHSPIIGFYFVLVDSSLPYEKSHILNPEIHVKAFKIVTGVALKHNCTVKFYT